VNTFTIVLTVAVVFLIMASVIYSLFQKLKEHRNVIKDLEKELDKAQKNVVYLVNHAEELQQIKINEQELENQLGEAQDDEEVYNIVNGIIDANNSIVQKHKTE
jgi:Tfp pilus assembly protein PilO